MGLVDEMGTSMVEHIVEGEDQGPTKEWGSHGWFCHPIPSDIAKAQDGKLLI